MIDWVVAPFDHRYELAALAVSVTLPPAHKVVGPSAVIVAAGNGLTVSVAELEGTEPQELVTTTS